MPTLGYGTIAAFRGGLTARRLAYTVDVNPTHVYATLLEPVPSSQGMVMSPRAIAETLPSRAYRAVTWREGTGDEMSSRFARAEVRLARPDQAEPEEQTLLIEWPLGDKAPKHGTLSTLPKRTSLREPVRLTKQRWRTERIYEDMKGELGLDHFEGRTYRGWQHHVTAALACYAFVTTALRWSFPPSARTANSFGAFHRPTRTPLRRLLHHDAARPRSGHRRMAASLPLLSPTCSAKKAVSQNRHTAP